MGVRHVPDLTFAIDRSEKMTGRMDELLTRMRKRDRRKGTIQQQESGPPTQ